MQSSGWTPPLSDILEVVTSPEFTSTSTGVINEERVVQHAPTCPASPMVHEVDPPTVISDVDDVQSVRSSGSSSQQASGVGGSPGGKGRPKSRARGRTTRTHRRQRNAITLFGWPHKEQTDGTCGSQLKHGITWQGSGVARTRPCESTVSSGCRVTVHNP